MMKNMKYPSWCTTNSGLLVLRIGVGLIFLLAGWMKASDMTATVGQFGMMGFVPFWAYLVTAVELLAGISVLLGLCTRVAAGLLAIVMIVAICVVYKDPLIRIVTGCNDPWHSPPLAKCATPTTGLLDDGSKP